jgi:glycosyltransferase involved in cell wall biosynthesis
LGDRTVPDPRNKPTLSICIATYKRAAFIAETLQSIVEQLTPEVEVVIVDGASPDDTPEVVARIAARCPALRYYRENENSGADGDYDKAVGYAEGEYCWLMTDDDVLIHGAIRRVLEALGERPNLVVVNAEVRNVDLTANLESPRLNVVADLAFDANEREEFFIRTMNYLSFIGGVVIRRDAWLARNRASYYGSLFIHVGVIFQSPAIENTKVIAQPLIAIRDLDVQVACSRVVVSRFHGRRQAFGLRPGTVAGIQVPLFPQSNWLVFNDGVPETPGRHRPRARARGRLGSRTLPGSSGESRRRRLLRSVQETLARCPL